MENSLEFQNVLSNMLTAVSDFGDLSKDLKTLTEEFWKALGPFAEYSFDGVLNMYTDLSTGNVIVHYVRP